jgi:hypothetical protein
MVERVARAICEEEIGGKLPGALDNTGSAKHWRNLACVAIASLREPSEEMCEAGNEYDCAPLAKEVWQAMIDEALR